MFLPKQSIMLQVSLYPEYNMEVEPREIVVSLIMWIYPLHGSLQNKFEEEDMEKHFLVIENGNPAVDCL